MTGHTPIARSGRLAGALGALLCVAPLGCSDSDPGSTGSGAPDAPGLADADAAGGAETVVDGLDDAPGGDPGGSDEGSVDAGDADAPDVEPPSCEGVVCPSPDDPCVAELFCEDETGLCTGQLFVPADEDCDTDGDVCTFERCDGAGACVDTGIVDDCAAENLANPCWTYICASKTGCIKSIFVEGVSCQDNNPCTVNDTCTTDDLGQKLCLGTPVLVDDGNACTDDSCVDGTVIYTPLTGTSCPSKDPCSELGTCDAGSCVPNTPCACQVDTDCPPSEDACLGSYVCDTSGAEPVCVIDPETEIACPAPPSPCQVATCDPETGECGVADAPDGTLCDDASACTTDDACLAGACVGAALPCDDGLPCNGVETCDPGEGCVPGSPPDLDDGIACTVDACDDALGVTHTPDDATCDDGNPCTGTEACDPRAGCLPGTPPDLDDGVACTVDACDPATGPTHTPDDALCDDGTVCTGYETCDAAAGCLPGTPLNVDDGVDCTVDTCDPISGAVFLPDDDACADDDVCNGAEVCTASGCEAGAPLAIDDGVDCTVDACDPLTGVSHTPDHLACDDGQLCNGDELCDPVSGCIAGPTLDPDDGVPCTIDACDEANGVTHTPDDAACDDGQACNGAETCDLLAGCQSEGAPALDDGNPCTIDACDDVLGVTHTPSDALCDDGDVCNGSESCDLALGCQAGTPLSTDDGVDCTIDACDPVAGVSHTPNDGACADGVICNGEEVCDALSGCEAGSPPVLDDGIPCTIDACDETSGVTHTPDDAACADGVICNGAEVCNTQSGCQPGPPPTLDDGVDCTVDGCNETDGVVHVPVDAFCSDGLVCNGDEVCNSVAGCLPGAPPTLDDGVACTVDGCNEAEGVTHTPVDALCDDNAFCNGSEVCNPILGCLAGAPPSTDDGIACTIDGCDETNGVTHTPDDGACDDGQACNGTETCVPASGCESSSPPDVDDGNPCTIDSCDDVLGVVHTPSDALCDDGDVCNGTETCDAALGCQAGTPPVLDDGIPCTIDACDPVTGVSHTPDDSACDDGDLCDGSESCFAGVGCQPGVPPTLDDGIPCTIDSCDPVAGVTHTPSDPACDDGVFCDGAEVCDPALGCQPGVPPATDDGVPCTVDACDEINGVTHTPDDGACDDGDVCDGVESCDPAAGCQAGTPPTLDDGVACTIDACDPVTGVSHTPDDGACDDGQACNGAETCDPAADCQAGTPPTLDDGVFCTIDDCDETNGVTHTPTDALCDDGAFCNGSETCDPVADCQPGTPPDVDDGIPCTMDDCGEGAGIVHIPVDADCQDGDLCNGTETCNPASGCEAGTPIPKGDGNACTDDFCDPATGNLTHVPNDSYCQNSTVCDGLEVCDVDAGCVPGTPPVVDDGIPCTVDACDPVGGVTHTPNDAACDDGDSCTVDVCVAGQGCDVAPGGGQWFRHHGWDSAVTPTPPVSSSQFTEGEDVATLFNLPASAFPYSLQTVRIYLQPGVTYIVHARTHMGPGPGGILGAQTVIGAGLTEVTFPAPILFPSQEPFWISFGGEGLLWTVYGDGDGENTENWVCELFSCVAFGGGWSTLDSLGPPFTAIDDIIAEVALPCD